MVHLGGHKLNAELTQFIRDDPDYATRRHRVRVTHTPHWRLRGRLSKQDVERLVAAFKAGTTKHILAKRYKINIKSVKKLLRERGVKRRSRWDKAA